jgi:hypothetical protein
MYIIEVVRDGQEIVETRTTRSRTGSLDTIKRLLWKYPDCKVYCVWKGSMSVVADRLETSRKEN